MAIGYRDQSFNNRASLFLLHNVLWTCGHYKESAFTLGRTREGMEEGVSAGKADQEDGAVILTPSVQNIAEAYRSVFSKVVEDKCVCVRL